MNRETGAISVYARKLILDDEEIEDPTNQISLKDAQKNPDKYHNLVVRIAGYSAYFVDMTEAMQNDVISRAEHSF